MRNETDFASRMRQERLERESRLDRIHQRREDLRRRHRFEELPEPAPANVFRFGGERYRA